MSRKVIVGIAAVVVALAVAMALAFALRTDQPSNIYDAVARNHSTYVGRWLGNGGDPNLRSHANESLLYIATGPKGGHKVLELLLEACGNPGVGAPSGYTPLMNAASWVDLRAVNLLLAYGADPQAKNEAGERAVDVVGLAGGREREVIKRLEEAMSKSKTPNHSLQPTQAGCAVRPAEFKR